jgi:hypothetical protein
MDTLVGRATTRWRILVTLTVVSLALAACGSSGASSAPTVASSVPTTASSIPTTGPTAASSSAPTAAAATPGASSSSATIAVKCPSADVVGQALGQVDTGPVTASSDVGGQAMTICAYSIGGGSNQTAVSFTTFPSLAVAAIGKTHWAGEGTAVPGLGDAAYSVAANGTLGVFVGSIFLSIASKGASEAQLEGLARTLLGG